MKIGLVRRGYSATGGAERYLERFAAALAAQGGSSVLFTGREWRGDWPWGEIRVVPGGTPRAFADAFAALDPHSLCDGVFSLERVWKCDCYRAGDGVHRAWLERRAQHEPHWKTWFRSLRPKHRSLLALESSLFKDSGASSVIVNSRMVKDEITRYYDGDPSRIHVIYNGLPQRSQSVPEREAARKQLDLPENALVLLFAGSGWERKGLREAIAATDVASSKPILLVAGRGNPARFPSSGRVRFLGPVKGMESLLAAADVFLLPTLYDPFSNACLEALAAGLPVITTSANGFSEIIEPGVDGEVLPESPSAAAIAGAIDRWSDPGKRAAARPRLIELASPFTIEANLQATLAILGSGTP